MLQQVGCAPNHNELVDGPCPKPGSNVSAVRAVYDSDIKKIESTKRAANRLLDEALNPLLADINSKIAQLEKMSPTEKPLKGRELVNQLSGIQEISLRLNQLEEHQRKFGYVIPADKFATDLNAKLQESSSTDSTAPTVNLVNFREALSKLYGEYTQQCTGKSRLSELFAERLRAANADFEEAFESTKPGKLPKAREENRLALNQLETSSLTDKKKREELKLLQKKAEDNFVKFERLLLDISEGRALTESEQAGLTPELKTRFREFQSDAKVILAESFSEGSKYQKERLEIVNLFAQAQSGKVNVSLLIDALRAHPTLDMPPLYEALSKTVEEFKLAASRKK
jgi:hypothetical protein